VIALIGILLSSTLAAEPVPAIRCEFLLPEEGAIVSGPTKLKAFAASNTEAPLLRVEFYVDGRLAGSDSKPPFEWLFDFGASGAQHLLMAKAIDSTGRAQHAYRRTRGVTLHVKQQVLLVELDLTVSDRAGRRLAGLVGEDLEVRENGRPQEIESFAVEPRPLRIVLVLDSSASMKRKLWRAQEAAIQLLTRLGPTDQAAVIEFDDRVRLAAPLGADPSGWTRAVRAVRADGKTHLFDALIAGIEALSGAAAGRRALILLTDGRDEGSVQTFSAAVEAARRGEVAAYVVGLRESGADLDGAAEPPFIAREEYLMRWLAGATGGAAYFPDHVGQLEGIYQEILEELRSQYRLAYYSSNPQRDGKWRKVEIRAKRPELVVRARPGYFARREQDTP
jgi:Ca-activated chloride channel family protein